MSIIDRLRAASVRCVLAPDGVAYKIRRVRSVDLAEHAVVELVGGLEVQKEIERIKKEQAAAAKEWRAAHIDPTQKEEAERKAEERDAHNTNAAQMAMARTIARNPSLFKGWMARTDAYVCAGVVGAVEFSGPEEAIASLAYDPLSLCADISNEDPERDRIWVGHLDQQTRQFLAEAVSELSGAPSVAPFRESAGRPSSD